MLERAVACGEARFVVEVIAGRVAHCLVRRGVASGRCVVLGRAALVAATDAEEDDADERQEHKAVVELSH